MQAEVTPRSISQVWLLFYRPSESDPFQNKLVANLSKKQFCHVEIAFAERVGEEPWEKKMWGSSIYQGESVFYEAKRYKRDGYVSFTLEVSPQQLKIMKACCQARAEAKVPFNLWAMYFAYLPCQLWNWGEGTFCSRHVTEVLQQARVPHVLHLNASQVTPSSLYCALVQHQGRTPESPLLMQLVPSRMHRGEQAEQMRQQLLASRVT